MSVSKKNIFSVIALFLILSMALLCPLKASAQLRVSNPIDGDSYPLLREFLDEAIKSPNSKLEAFDANNKNITIGIKALYFSDRIEVIADMIKKSGLQLSSKAIISVDESLRGSVITENFSQIYPQSGESQGFVREWIVGLTGSITYSTVTNRILSASSPSVYVIETGNFGPLFYPYLDNVSTGRTIKTSSVDFWGRYTMMAMTDPSLGGSHNFGTYTLNMTAYPAF